MSDLLTDSTLTPATAEQAAARIKQCAAAVAGHIAITAPEGTSRDLALKHLAALARWADDSDALWNLADMHGTEGGTTLHWLAPYLADYSARQDTVNLLVALRLLHNHRYTAQTGQGKRTPAPQMPPF